MSLKHPGDRRHGIFPWYRGLSKPAGGELDVSGDGRVVWLTPEYEDWRTLNGGDISALLDRSTTGSTNNFTQGTEANQPLLEVASSVLNGLDSAHYTPDNFLEGTYFDMSSGFSMSLVFSADNLSSLYALVAAGGWGAQSRMLLFLGTDGTLNFRMNTTNTSYISRRTDVSHVTAATKTGVIAVFAPSADDDSDIKIYDLDGTQVDTTDAGAGTYTGVPSTSTEPIQTGVVGTLFEFDGEQGQVSMWPSALDASAISAEGSRLKTIYGIT